MGDVYQPAVGFREVGQPGLGRGGYVHKVNVLQTAVEKNTVDIEGKEHQSKDENKTIFIIFYGEFQLFREQNTQSKGDEHRVIDKVLKGDYPFIQCGIGGDKKGSQRTD